VKATVPRSIVLAPGAEENLVASWLYASLRRGHGPDLRREPALAGLRATVGFVATDQRLAATVRFDRGAVVIHDGSVGTPDLTFSGRRSALDRLSTLRFARFAHLPSGAAWFDSLGDLVNDDLKVYGLLGRPRLAYRVLRLLADR
jgi:hypothetical protein